MANPTNPTETNPTVQTASTTPGMMSSLGTDPMTTSAPTTATAGAAAPAAASAGASSSSGDFWSTLGSDLSSFFSSPLGNLTEFSALAGLGLSQANSQKNENDTLAKSLSDLGAPFSSAADQTLTQLQGGAQAPGPAGASVAQQTTAAAGLGDIANTAIKNYNSGTLQPWQQQQIDDFKAQQRAMVDSQLAASGNTDSSAKDAAYQQIESKAQEMAGTFNQQDLQTGEQALTQVQTTYNNLINQMLSEASFGFGAQSQAVQLQIQSDTQLSQSLNQLFAGIAQGFGEAMRGPSGGGASGSSSGSSTGNLLGSALNKLLGGNSGFSAGDLASTEAGTNAALTQDLAPTLSAPDLGADVPDATGGGDLYSGSQAANADVAAQEADQYAAGGGLSALTAPDYGASAATGAGEGIGSAAGEAVGGAAATAATAAAADSAATSAGAGILSGAGTAAGDAAGGALGSAAGGSAAGAGAGSGVGVAAGAAGAIAILAAMGVVIANNSGSYTAGGFVNSVVGSGYFTAAQNKELQQKYQELGEDGFWQWFNNDSQFAAFAAAQKNTGNNRANYRQT